jgi:hypothetical protein
VLFRVLAGRMPFIGVGAGDVMAMHQYEEPPALAELAPWLPAELTELVHRLLRKDKAQRPSMREVAAELERLIASLKDLAMPEPPPLAAAALPGVVEGSWRASFPGEEAEGLDSDSMMPTLSAESSRASTPGISRELGLSLSQPSTLHGSVGERKQRGAPTNKERRLAFAAVGVALLAGALVLVLSLRSAPPRPRPAPQLAAPQPTPSAPRRVTWSIASEPAGAEIVRLSDGKVLGRTPWRAEAAAQPGSEELAVRLTGHADLRIRLERGRDERRDVVLQPEPRTTTTTTTTGEEKRSGSRRSRTSRSRLPTEG